VKRPLVQAFVALLVSPVVLAQGSPDTSKSDGDEHDCSDLEQRVLDLEALADDSGSAAGLSRWLDSIRLSGSANVGYFGGEDDTSLAIDTFKVWDARFFIEADLGHDLYLGGTLWLRDLGFLFEWDLARIGSERNRSGELYVDLQGIADSDWLNAQIGRFQLPLGENYLRFSQGYKNNPFVSNTVGGPWWPDEGARIYGTAPDKSWGYVSSVTGGENSFTKDVNRDLQATLKLFTDPTDWLHLSASGLRSGTVGSSTSAARSALWQGESLPSAFGSMSRVQSYQNGAPVVDGPNKLDSVTFVGVDAVLTLEERASLWLAYGVTEIDSDGPSLYDRMLRYWNAELVIEGGWLSDACDAVYAGLRFEGYGTYDDNEGYLLDLGYGSTLGYNMQALEAYSAVLGWRLTESATLRAQYTLRDIELVNGVTAAIRSAADEADYFAVEFAISF
jgi:hypothetical protein